MENKEKIKCRNCGKGEEPGFMKIVSDKTPEVVYLCEECLSEDNENLEDMEFECFICEKKFKLGEGFAQVEHLQADPEESVVTLCSKHCYANFLHSGLSTFDMSDEMNFCDFCKKEINGLSKAGIMFYDEDIVDTWNFCSQECYKNHVKKEVLGEEKKS